MEQKRISVMLLDEASEFLRSLPEKPRKKILYNIQRVERGEVDEEKTSKKTPSKEIARAEKIRKEYLSDKEI